MEHVAGATVVAGGLGVVGRTLEVAGWVKVRVGVGRVVAVVRERGEVVEVVAVGTDEVMVGTEVGAGAVVGAAVVTLLVAVGGWVPAAHPAIDTRAPTTAEIATRPRVRFPTCPFIDASYTP